MNKLATLLDWLEVLKVSLQILVFFLALYAIIQGQGERLEVVKQRAVLQSLLTEVQAKPNYVTVSAGATDCESGACPIDNNQ